MNRSGFTIIEILAVVVILSILSSLAVVGVTRYRQEVKKKEIINLHSTIEAAYDDYRSNYYLKGKTPESTMDFCTDGKMIMDIAYNGERLNCSDISSNSFLSIKVKGDLLDSNRYNYIGSGKSEEELIKDGICLVNVEKVKEGNQDILKKSCAKSNGEIVPSKEEITCIYLKVKDEEVIDDFHDNNSLCSFFAGVNDE